MGLQDHILFYFFSGIYGSGVPSLIGGSSTNVFLKFTFSFINIFQFLHLFNGGKSVNYVIYNGSASKSLDKDY